MKIEFIIPTYERTDLLMTCISSIVSQTNPNWKINVVVDGPTEEVNERISRIAEYYKDEPRIKWTILENRYNDWGHTPRNIGLGLATEEWVLMTGEDNYYTPVFVDMMLKAGKNSDFVFCNMVHNWTDNQYFAVDCSLKYGKIDIGNFMVKTKMGNKLKLNNKVGQADWYYIRDFLKEFPDAKIVKVNKILYVHN